MTRLSARTGSFAWILGLGLIAAGPARTAPAQEKKAEPPAHGASSPVVRVYTAGDFARLAEGVAAPGEGRFHVRVWAPAKQSWSLSAKDNQFTFELKVDGDDSAPRWQDLGEATLKAGAPLKVVTTLAEKPKPADQDKEKEKPAPKKDEVKAKAKEKGKEKAAEKKKAAPKPPPGPTPVPALLVLSTVKETPWVLDFARGRVDSVDPPADPRRSTVRTNKEGAAFRAPATEQAWRDRARAVREQLLVSLGLWPMPPKTPLHPKVVGKLERDGYTIEKVLLETIPGFTLGGNLYRPVGKKGKLPAVLCPHGHWADGRVNPEVQQRCIRLAKLGFVVFMYDMVGYNDSKAFGHTFLNDRLKRWGYSLVSLQTWDSIRVVDWITSLPDVDSERLGCTGESGGGTQTFLLTAVDDRVKVAAPIVMVSDWFQGGCVCENCAGLRWGTDNIEFAALAAPRPMKLVGATGDWTARTISTVYPPLRDVYTLTGRPERLSADLFNFNHNYNQTSRNAVYPFLARWLMGLEDSEALREGDQKPEKPEDLWAYTEASPAPSNLKTAAQLEDHLVRTLGWELEGLAPSTSRPAWEASRDLLRTSHRVRVGVSNPAPADLAATEVRRASHGGVTVLHARVGLKSTGESIPVVRLIPKDASGKLTVIASVHGKAALASTGPVEELVRALTARGQSVVLFDPLLVGESVDPAAPASSRPTTEHYDTYNRSLAADQMQDLATVLAWARSLPDVRQVSLAGLGRAGAQTLIARPALEGVARTAVDLHEFDAGDGSARIGPEVDLPGLLQFGGIKSAAALTSPAPLWVFRPAASFDRSWPEKAYALDDVTHQLRIEHERPSAEALARWLDAGE
ncbi:MAG: CocE/NonD family hydrolase [Isosphaeraceae bacterium]